MSILIKCNKLIIRVLKFKINNFIFKKYSNLIEFNLKNNIQ